MKNTIADFKRKMKVGSMWRCASHYLPAPVYRVCTHSQTNSFALEAPLSGRGEGSSWADWPKSKDCVWITEQDGQTVAGLKIQFGPGVWVYYEPVNKG